MKLNYRSIHTSAIGMGYGLAHWALGCHPSSVWFDAFMTAYFTVSFFVRIWLEGAR